MTCPINRYSSIAQCNAYLETRPRSPAIKGYVDTFTNCAVSFTWGFNRRVSRDTWMWAVNGCNYKAGIEGPTKALRTALMRDCQARGIAPGSPTLTPLELTPESDPTTSYGRLLRGETVPEPYPVAPKPIAIKPPLSTSEVSPMTMPSQYPGGPVPILPTIGTPTTGVSGFSTYGIPPVISNVPWKPINGGGGVIGGAVETLLGGATDWLNRQLFGGGTTGGGETVTSPGTNITGFTQEGPCPTGSVWRNGRCESTGITGTLQRWIPGGETGVVPQAGAGMLMGGVTPHVEAQPRSYCPTGYVLGRDGLCYDKRVIPNKLRKYPRGRRPLLTGGEMKVLSKARTLENKVKRAWTAAGKPGQTRCRRK